MVELPTGTVTFLFTDLEVSTRLWEQEPDRMRDALARHDVILRHAVAAHGGTVVKGRGDGVHAAFATAHDAVAAAVDGQIALGDESWSVSEPLAVRMGLHTGVAELRDGDYFGSAVNRAARLMDLAHGGQIVCSQASADLAGEFLPASVTLVDVGEHRLRDLSRPERVFQIVHPELRSDFPLLRSVDAFPGNLPFQTSSFIGREREISRALDALRESRIVTLSGVGGVGKTRLAYQVAAQVLPDFRDGAWLVELAGVRDPVGVVDAFAAVFAITPRAGQSMDEALADFLGAKRLLLVVDNCEHLLDAVAKLVVRVERSCAYVRFLATSREGLAVDGERVVPVPSLDTPDDDNSLAAVATSESVQLFVERAAASDVDFELDSKNFPFVTQVCRRLDGVPLAIELAAARITMMNPAELANALDHRFDVLAGGRRGGIERHQTLRATIDWSYDLLTERHRRLLARLAVFAGGCTRQAADAVCTGDPIEPGAVFQLLGDLVARSLVVADRSGSDTRYRLLETIRAYAEERLDEYGETRAVRDRHARYWVERGRTLADGLRGPDQIEWGNRLTDEHDNLMAAMFHALDTQDVDLAIGELVAMDATRGLQTGYELRLPAEAVIALPGAAEHPDYLAALVVAAFHAAERGDLDRADQHLDMAAALAGESNTEDGPTSPTALSVAALHVNELAGQARGAWRDAATASVEAAELSRARGRPLPAASRSAAFNLAMAGDDEAAIPLAHEAVELSRRAGVPGELAASIAVLALALAAHDPRRSHDLIDEAADLHARHDYEANNDLLFMAFAAARLADWPLTARFARRSIRHLHWSNQRPRVGGMLNVAASALADSDPRAAATLLGAARSFAPRRPTGTSSPSGAPIGDGRGAGLVVELRRATTTRVRETLGDELMSELREQGASLDPDTAVAFALSSIDAFLARVPEDGHG
jgi:predicted ATPase/class 3 adenylate cyclase